MLSQRRQVLVSPPVLSMNSGGDSVSVSVESIDEASTSCASMEFTNTVRANRDCIYVFNVYLLEVLFLPSCLVLLLFGILGIRRVCI